MRIRTLIVLLAIGAAVAVAWLTLGPPSPRRTASHMGERIELPALPLGRVDRLREKAVAGTDGFVVEELERELAPRLARLERVFADPLSSTSETEWPRLAARGMRWDPLIPSTRSPERVVQGVKAYRYRTERDAAPRPERRSAGRGERETISRLIQPLERLARAELKPIEIHRDPDSTTLRATVRFELSGREGSGPGYEWTGLAVLDWDTTDWTLLRWSTRELAVAQLAGLPFQDATRAAFGASPYFRDVLAQGLDAVRRRLDAASGIEVYGHYGLAIGDADGDDLDDVYLPMMPLIPNLLFLGRPGGAFEDASHASGADILDGTSHALFLDVDNDGDQDLVLVLDGGLLLLENGGAGAFTRRPDALPDVRAARATPLALAAADYDLDGLVDLYVTSYVFWQSHGAVGSRLPYPYHDAENGAPNVLLRNGGGRFDDVTTAARLHLGNARFSFAAAWGDYDDDGDPDLYVANDFGANNLYRNLGDGTFRDVAAESGVSDIGPGMSVAWEDYDNDGHLDLYVGNMFSAAGRRVTAAAGYKPNTPGLQRIYQRHARGNSLFRNLGDGTFEDVSVPSGAYFGRWAWASGFIDFNLDGHEDLYVQNGFITNTRAPDL